MFLPAIFLPILIDMDSRDYHNFKDFAEIADCWLNDETINQMLEEMEPKKFDVEEYLNSNYDY